MVNRIKITLNPKVDYISLRYFEEYLKTYGKFVDSWKADEGHSIIAIKSDEVDRLISPQNSLSKIVKKVELLGEHE